MRRPCADAIGLFPLHDGGRLMEQAAEVRKTPEDLVREGKAQA
ncbi:MAG: hypothetical protein N2109_12200 [Fimbriimonadales bacterium]|nr:hypothetical protein [Fimbriimonadales bacterium]